jgi:hypothetical protein
MTAHETSGNMELTSGGWCIKCHFTATLKKARNPGVVKTVCT